MGLIYYGAPACSFKPSHRKSVFMRHHTMKGWCPCKEAGWTIDDAVQGQQDGRFKSQEAVGNEQPQVNIQTTGDNSPVNAVINNVVVFNVSPSVLPAGSEAERSFLKTNAETILKAIVAGVDGPGADILSRFVRETWCSDQLPQLNNVMALKSNNLEFIRLCEQGGQKKIETFAGKEAPGQLVELALKNMTQLSKDSCGGYNPAWPVPACYEKAHETKEGAEAEHAKYGAGRVYFRKEDGKWVNDRSTNPPPAVTPALFKEADQVAFVPHTLRRKRGERKRVARVVTTQLQQVPDKRDKKRKLLAAAE